MAFNIKRYKFIILDFDDVIIETFIQSSKLAMLVSEPFEGKVLTKEDIIICWGGTMPEFFGKLKKLKEWSQEQLDTFVARFYRLQQSISFNLSDGAGEFIDYCQCSNIKLGILTNRDPESLRKLLFITSIGSSTFAKISAANGTGGDKLQRFKEEISPLLQAEKISLSKTLFIGDSLTTDWPVARDHQPPFDFIGRITDMVPEEKFEEHGIPCIKYLSDLLP